VSQPKNSGNDFDDADVARAYANRAAYPPALFEALAELAGERTRALDLGCGPGKLAIPLADRFDEVWAVDLSGPMIGAGRAADAGAHPNLRWIHGRTEDLDTRDGEFDLAVAGASIHWMDHARLFPRLARWLKPGAVIAVVEGDAPAQAPWRDAYGAVIRGWVERLGGVWNNPATVAASQAHEAWIGEARRLEFAHDVRMGLEALIDGEHSRATWTRAKLGPELSAAFDSDLRRVLAPHAEDGMLTFTVRTRLLCGRPLAERALPMAG
jgi:ubiquinone/menaquinone biosynthesis C-methylase UbiE